MAGPFETLDAALKEADRALTAIVNGDPSIYLGLFADREEISLGNPFGPFGRGREGVGRNLANAATKYSDGEALGVERVATYASGDIACFVEVEHIRAKLGDGPVTDVRARATTIYERRDGGWNLVHRHADPITTPRWPNCCWRAEARHRAEPRGHVRLGSFRPVVYPLAKSRASLRTRPFLRYATSLHFSRNGFRESLLGYLGIDRI